MGGNGRMRMGGGFGFGGRLRRGKAFSLSFSMGNAKVTLDQGTADQGKPYGNGKGYPATNAFVSGGGKFTHTASGAGMFWKCGFQGKQNAWVWKVRVLNRKDCCGDRLSGTKVSIGGQECGTISGTTKNGQWYEVKCSKPIRGNQIILETTRNVYLSISGIEVYSATCSGNGCGGASQSTMRTTTSTSTTRSMPRMIKMGGMGKMTRMGGNSSSSYNVAANTKVGFNVSSAKQSTNYSNSNYLPDFAFKGPSKFTHTKKGVGQWWEVGFNQGYWVDRVRVRNRKDCCGSRLN
jgi:hypothetical protein